MIAYLLDGHVRRDELLLSVGVDTVEARPLNRRRGNAHVNLGRTRIAKERDELLGRVAAHDRVVDDDEPLALDRVLERIELEADALLPDRLARRDERAADVAVL